MFGRKSLAMNTLFAINGLAQINFFRCGLNLTPKHFDWRDVLVGNDGVSPNVRFGLSTTSKSFSA